MGFLSKNRAQTGTERHLYLLHMGNGFVGALPHILSAFPPWFIKILESSSRSQLSTRVLTKISSLFHQPGVLHLDPGLLRWTRAKFPLWRP